MEILLKQGRSHNSLEKERDRETESLTSIRILHLILHRNHPPILAVPVNEKIRKRRNIASGPLAPVAH